MGKGDGAEMRYPILYSFAETVYGERLGAAVTVHGRALLTEGADGWWMSGVQPGGLAGNGGTKGDAYLAFRKNLHFILSDILEESKNVPDFEAKVAEFFQDADWITGKEWEETVCEPQRGRARLDETVDRPLPSCRIAQRAVPRNAEPFPMR